MLTSDWAKYKRLLLSNHWLEWKKKSFKSYYCVYIPVNDVNQKICLYASWGNQFLVASPEISHWARHLRCCQWRVGLEEHTQRPQGARVTSEFSSTARCFNSSPWRWRTTSYQRLDEKMLIQPLKSQNYHSHGEFSPWCWMNQKGTYHWVIGWYNEWYNR